VQERTRPEVADQPAITQKNVELVWRIDSVIERFAATFWNPFMGACVMEGLTVHRTHTS
jgi:hypothetical protein